MANDKENIFESIENDPNFDELMKNFKLTCPVKKINLKVDEPNCIAGMWLISSDDIDMKSKADMDNLEDNTILYFTNQHIVELAKILFGMLILITQNKIIKQEDVYPIITEYMSFVKSINTYNRYKKMCSDIVNKWFNLKSSNATTNFLAKFIEILELMIFMPYNELDNLAQEAIDNFSKSMKEEEKNNE